MDYRFDLVHNLKNSKYTKLAEEATKNTTNLITLEEGGHGSFHLPGFKYPQLHFKMLSKE